MTLPNIKNNMKLVVKIKKKIYIYTIIIQLLTEKEGKKERKTNSAKKNRSTLVQFVYKINKHETRGVMTKERYYTQAGKECTNSTKTKIHTKGKNNSLQ